MITMGVTMLISAITSASLTCRPLCCSPTQQGVVHYCPNNNQVNQVSEANATSVVLNVDELGKIILPAVQDMQAIPTNSPRLASDSSALPGYQDVAGVGSKYQKF